jgi:hypothetical protein
VLVIGFFQLVVLQQNIPNLFDIALGTGKTERPTDIATA